MSHAESDAPKRNSFTSTASKKILSNKANTLRKGNKVIAYISSIKTIPKPSTTTLSTAQKSSSTPLIVKVDENEDLPERLKKEETPKMTFKKTIPRERSKSISKVEDKTSSLSNNTVIDNSKRSVSNPKTIKTNTTHVSTITPSPSQSPPTVDFTNSIQIDKYTEENFLIKLNRRRNCEYKELKKLISNKEKDDKMINELLNDSVDANTTVTTTSTGTNFDNSVLSIHDIDLSTDSSSYSPIKDKNLLDVASPTNKIVDSVKNKDLEEFRSVPNTPPTPQCKLPVEEKITYEMENAFQILMQSRRNACYKSILNITKV